METERERDCGLCRDRLLTPVVRQTRFWRTAVNRNQNLLGKVLIALRRHEESVARLSAEEWLALQDELGWVTRRLIEAFSPEHFNYAFLQNEDRHVHLHVIPRYASERRFAGIIFTDPDYPDHYRPGVEKLVQAEVIAAILEALTAQSGKRTRAASQQSSAPRS